MALYFFKRQEQAMIENRFSSGCKKMNKGNQAYFYMPKEIMSSEYKDYSAETKLLFSMLISNAKTASAIADTAKLIEDIGVRKISSMHKSLESEIAKIKESEGA